MSGTPPQQRPCTHTQSKRSTSCASHLLRVLHSYLMGQMCAHSAGRPISGMNGRPGTPLQNQLLLNCCRDVGSCRAVPGGCACCDWAAPVLSWHLLLAATHAGGHNTRPNSRESGGPMWLLLHTGPTACRPTRPARGHNVAVCHTRHTTSLNAMTTSLPLVTRTDAGDTCSCFWVDSR